MIHVRIDLRRGDTGMAQHFLDLPKIRAAGQEVGCEAVPERVGADIWWRVGPQCIFFNNFPDPFPAQRATAG